MLSVSSKKEIDFFSEFEKFIKASRSGRRLQPNGKRLSAGTTRNYEFTLSLVRKFCDKKQFRLCIRPVRRLNSREMEREKNYWKKFYRLFSAYLYEDCGYFDNYAGQNIKIIRSFFNYLNKDKALGVGDFHRQFYVRKEEIPIFPLMPEELNFLIHDKNFEDSLETRMKEVKDFFVFGCTVALRFSDINALSKNNIRQIGNNHYLSVRSIKTGTDTLIRLPDYAVTIIQKYAKLKKRLLPPFNKVNLNKYIKKLLELAGFTQTIAVSRSRRGQTVALKNNGQNAYRFCDAATTHTMRRTAITTMLSLGMPEQMVRKISGHSANSKEFYRYVSWSQHFQDKETEKMFERLRSRGVVSGE